MDPTYVWKKSSGSVFCLYHSASQFQFALTLKPRALNFVRNFKRLIKLQHMVAIQAAQCKVILLHTKYYPGFQKRVFWVLDYLKLSSTVQTQARTSRNAGSTVTSVHESYSCSEARNTQWTVEQIKYRIYGASGVAGAQPCFILESNPLSPCPVHPTATIVLVWFWDALNTCSFSVLILNSTLPKHSY